MSKTAEYNGIKHEFIDTDGQHCHKIDGAETISVTTMLQKIGILPEYPDTEAVRMAAKRGSDIHAQIEGTMPIMSYEAAEAKKFIQENYDWGFHEVLVSYKGIYAGIVDYFGHNFHTDTFDIIDWKSGKFTPFGVGCQEFSYYKGLDWMGKVPEGMKVRYLVGDLKPDKCTFEEVPVPTDKEFDKMMDCLRDGKTYREPSFVIEVPNNATEVEEAEIERFFELWKKMPKTVRYAVWKSMKSEGEEFEKDIKKQQAEKGKKVAITPDGYWFKFSPRTDTRPDEEYLKKHCPKTYEKSLVTRTYLCMYFKGKEGQKEKKEDAKSN